MHVGALSHSGSLDMLLSCNPIGGDKHVHEFTATKTKTRSSKNSTARYNNSAGMGVKMTTVGRRPSCPSGVNIPIDNSIIRSTLVQSPLYVCV